MSYTSSTFYNLKDAIVISEMQLLKRLGFNVQVQLPYASMVSYCQMLGMVEREGVVDRAWGFLNDSWVLSTSEPSLRHFQAMGADLDLSLLLNQPPDPPPCTLPTTDPRRLRHPPLHPPSLARRPGRSSRRLVDTLRRRVRRHGLRVRVDPQAVRAARFRPREASVEDGGKVGGEGLVG